MIYAKTQSQIVMTTTDIDSIKQPSTERIRTLLGSPRKVLCNRHAESYRVFQVLSKPSEITIEHYRRSNTYFGINRYWELDPHQITLTYPQTIYGKLPEPLRNHSGKSIKI